MVQPLRTEHPIVFWMTASLAGGNIAFVSAIGLFVAALHIRHNLILATQITIERPDRVKPGEAYDVRIYADGFPFGAGVGIGEYSIRPISRGWNTYLIVAPNEPGSYTVGVQLYSVDGGNPKLCEIIDPTPTRWFPSPNICLYQELDRATFQIDIESLRTNPSQTTR